MPETQGGSRQERYKGPLYDRATHLPDARCTRVCLLESQGGICARALVAAGLPVAAFACIVALTAARLPFPLLCCCWCCPGGQEPAHCEGCGYEEDRTDLSCVLISVLALFPRVKRLELYTKVCGRLGACRFLRLVRSD